MTGSSPLLPTPTAWLGRRSSHAIGNAERWHNPARSNELSDFMDTLRLLPTPTATPYGNNQSPSEGAAVRPALDGLVKLLPTPTKGEGKGARSSTAPARSESSEFTPGTTLTDLAFQWELSGVSTSPPSDAGKRSPEMLLRPCFVEWMLGLPDGWSDPDSPLSATEFKSRSDASPASTSSSSNGGD